MLNPVVFKDLLTVAVNPAGQSAGARLFLYSILFAIPLLGFAWAISFHAGPWRFAGRPVLLGLCALLSFFHVSVAVPAATAFALERDRNTLESLVISPLSPWRLVLGKLMTAVYVGVMGKAAVLPALAVAFVIGGADLAFIPRFLILLVAVDTSLAAFALHLGARRRDIQSKVGWIRAQTSQTQLVMQATVGVSVITSLVPIYAAIFLVPLAMQQGVQLSHTLETLAPLGVAHPLAALVMWGDAVILGLRVPLWVLGVIFHVLLALPLLADCAEAQKTEGSEPGHLPRLLTLPILAFTLLLAASIANRLGTTPECLVAVILPVFFVMGAAGRASFSKDPTVVISPLRLLRGLSPKRALASAPDSAVGYALLIVLLVSPLILYGGDWGAEGIRSLASLALVGVGLAALGARMTAKAQEKEDKAFLKALAKRNAGVAPEDAKEGAKEDAKEDEKEDEKDKSEKDKPRSPKRAGTLLFALSFFLVALGAIALYLIQKGAAPVLEPLQSLFVVQTAVGISLNPFASLLPILCDPALLGTDAFVNMLHAGGLDPSVLFYSHVGIYALIAVLSVVTLKKPVDLEKAMADHRAAKTGPAELAKARPGELADVGPAEVMETDVGSAVAEPADAGPADAPPEP